MLPNVFREPTECALYKLSLNTQKTHQYFCIKNDFQLSFSKTAQNLIFFWLCCAAQSVVQSCSALCNPMDCGPPGSCVHWFTQAAEYCSWLAFPSPGDFPFEPTSPVSPALQADLPLSIKNFFNQCTTFIALG